MTSPVPLSPALFRDFFRALWGYEPFPWQQDFANRLCAGLLPDYVTVPTGSGKTACLDAAVFALAVQASRPVAERTVGRRIFFVVNRRIIVDEAFERAKNHLVPALKYPQKYLNKREAEKTPEQRLSADALAKSESVLKSVADALRGLSGDAPLICGELRGGIYRDRAWAKSILQPMIVCSTVDQVGSRLLFRGYGVSHEARPVHAALVAQDSLLLIDEAHISQPFLQTLDWVRRYRLHQPDGAATVKLPFSVVRMTATPPKDEKAAVTLLELSSKDREHPILSRRLNAAKPVRLVLAPKAKGKNVADELVKMLVKQAEIILNGDTPPKSIAIMVNRVATARKLAEKFQTNGQQEVTLLIGRMRPLDRDQVTANLQSLLKTGVKPKLDGKLQIVISTQCLEVGADLDFDALVTECASLDALRQRFGRLNRAGRDIAARGIVVLPEEQHIEEKRLSDDNLADPIYGNAIPLTWHWLKSIATDDVVDFGLNAMTDAVQAARNTPEKEKAFARLLMPRADAPVLLPAYLDCWVQTNPAPATEPDVSLFLHGPQRDMAEVQVCWRADLPHDIKEWKDTVSLCPPTTLECLPVPLHLMRDYLKNGSQTEDTTGDSPAFAESEKEPEKTGENENREGKITSQIPALNWLGENSHRVFASGLRPGQTLVLRVEENDESWNLLGYIPCSTPSLSPPRIRDLAEEGRDRLHRRAVVRLHEKIWWPEGDPNPAAEQLKEWAKQKDFDWRAHAPEVANALKSVADAMEENAMDKSNDQNASRVRRLRFLAKQAKARKLIVEPYPKNSGVVLSTRVPLDSGTETDVLSAEDGPGDPLLETPTKQTLQAHTEQVTRLATRYTEQLELRDYRDAISTASKLHDIGKADPRFQAMLIQGTVSTALAQPVIWAKSADIPASPEARKKIRERAELPEGFRHEMLSTQLAIKLLTDASANALVLHLIASHHGHARPFAPIVFEKDKKDKEEPLLVKLDGKNITLSDKERCNHPAHAINSGIAERFWKLTRQHGWWGLALLETILRLADQTASATVSADTQNPSGK
jgi:CRISPR-associated endonuclease/helicase Cas3